MSSINTNRSALQALQAANAAARDLSGIEKRLSTGLKVAGTADDSAAFIVAQSLRSDGLMWHAVGKGLGRARSILDVGISGAEQISDLIVTLRQKGTDLADAGDADQPAIRRDIEALVDQIDRVAKSASFGGVNLLIGQPVTHTISSHSYGSGWTALPQNGFQVPMSALPPETLVEREVQTRHVLPPSPRTPESYAAIQRSMHGNVAMTIPMDGGAVAGRFNLLLEQTEGADSVEIWQHGVRVAATGRPYAAEGVPVGAGAPVDGPKVISFDYDPEKGQDLEVRVTPTGSTALSRFWQVSGLSLQDPAEPVPDPIREQAYSSRITTRAVFNPPIGIANPEQAAQALDDSPDYDAMPRDNVRTVDVLGGSVPGRVDVLFDAFDSPDSLEIWQDGVRIAATGQPYVTDGAPVGAATAVSGASRISFDYDPDKGPLSFRFNEGGAARESAWHVGAMTLRPFDSAPGPLSTGASSETQAGYGAIQYDFNSATNLTSQRIRSRDLTRDGLGLAGLGSASPDHVLDRILEAEDRVNKALSYLGNKARSFDMLAQRASTMADIRDAAVGTLVDADMAKEAAALQAAQVKQQLTTQALGIANRAPQFLLDLFK